MKTENTREKLFATTLLAGLALGLTPALAQEPTAQPEEEAEKQEAIVVTGSRIARKDFTAISPVVSIGAEQIELSATISVETLLNELPAVIPGNTFTSNNAGGEDFPTVDLRGLGPQRTLVLINGERVPGSSTTGVVDLSTIPASLIDRIEVLTGGTSVVYGSDAIAGAVNFILKDDFEGAEISGNYSGAFDGNATGGQINALIGGNLANGKGNITTHMFYANRNGVLQSEYDYSRVSGALVYGYDSATSSYTGIFFADSAEEYIAALNAPGQLATESRGLLVPGGSGTPPWGQISNSASNPFNYTTLQTNPATAGRFTNVNADCNPATAGTNITSGNLSFNDNNQLSPYLGSGACSVPIRANGSSRYNFAPDNYLVIPSERFGAQTFVSYDLADNVEFKGMLSYVSSRPTVQLAPTPITGLSIPVNSPAISGADGVLGNADDPHRDLSIALQSRPTPGANFTYAWRSVPVGARVGEFDTSSFLARGSLKGSLTDSWDWTVNAGYGRNQFNSILKNNVNRTALLQGVQGCANVPVAARLPGCVNVDIFGPNSLTSSAASFIRVDVKTQGTVEETNISAYLNGDLFELPAGAVAVSLGAEYREQEGSFIVDDAQRTGNIFGFNAQNSIFGVIDVKEMYGEAIIPILKDLPFADSVSLEVGYRYSDYNTVGGVASYKYGGEWSPFSWLTLRSIFNKATRAPSLLEAFQAGDQGFPSYSDPCRRQATSANAALLAFCTTNGNIGAGFVPAVNAPTFVANNSQVQAFSFGNPNLEPEEAETLTAGIVFQPDFLPVGDFRLTVDYYNIKLEKAIISRGAQTILNSCYGALGATAQSALDCQQIVRDAGTGQVTSVNTSLTNSLAITETSGIDVQAELDWDMDELISGAPGSFDVNFLLTYVDKYETGGFDIVGTTAAGIGGAVPEYKSVTTVNYSVGDWVFQARHTFVPALEDNQNFGYSTELENYSNFDAAARWDMTDNFTFSVNVDNVMDEQPPQFPSGTLDQANTDAAFYAPWVLGRTFAVSGKYKF